MSTTLRYGKSPVERRMLKSAHHPLKGIFARRYYGHDGSLAGEPFSLDANELDWLLGLAAGLTGDDRRFVQGLIKLIASQGSADIWIE